ncbi:holo-ACP synthase [Streptomyces sp. TBY4]|uniref:holo-ACP synthase n=1 Tax=Streptomyces sp. TBY4 TaxID=2962030 RepID=UPI0020B6BF64|nr:holo-ACP synthase [Streptomyces sp. TBY4]MCP3754416.1 holo-ACP synthase [Streptomyces sp. TBY4]
MGIGADLLRLHELDRLLRRPWFRAFAYTEAELAVAAGYGPDRAREFLAGRFAAKEAVLKAIGTGMTGGVRPCQVAVLKGDDGAPLVRLSGAAAERAAAAGLGSVGVSITHKGDLVLAVALAVPGRPDDGLLAGLADSVNEQFAA